MSGHCSFVVQDGRWFCSICGRTATVRSENPPVAECKAAAAPKPGLGDMVAAGLSAIGITKERVSALAGRDCGCTKRQEALNELGRRVGIG
jgi:hypothetical protein